jgi:hypothetical protein
MLYEQGYTTGYHRGKEIMFQDIVKWINENKDKDMYCDSYGNTDIESLIDGLNKTFNK